MNRFIRQSGKTETELDPKTCKTVSQALTNDAMGLSVFAIFNFLNGPTPASFSFIFIFSNKKYNSYEK